MKQRTVILVFLVATFTLTVGTLWYKFQQADTAKTLKEAVLSGMTADVQALETLKLERQQEKERLAIARLKDQQQAIPVWRNIKYSTGVGIVVIGGSSILLLSVAYRRKLLTHVLRIGVNEIPVNDKDLSKLSPDLTMALAAAQQAEAHKPEMSVELLKVVVPLILAQIKHSHLHRLYHQADPPALAPAPVRVPTFAELVQRREIAPGKTLLFGLTDTGDPARGTWQDLYSSAIAGQSGNGKSSTARSLILQSLLSGEIEAFYIADPHRHKPEGLVNTLGPVVNLKNVVYNETNFDIHLPIDAFRDRMQRRIQGIEPCKRPIVLVIDELLSVIKNVSGADEIVKTIGMQGRGFGCFGLFLAQSWVGADVGGTSARDNLTSLLVHRMKKKQASTLLQDSEWSKVASGLKPGEIIFEATAGEPCKLSVPLCTPADAITVYSMVADGNTVKLSGDIDTFFQKMSWSTPSVDLEKIPVNVAHPVDHEKTEGDLVDQVNAYLSQNRQSLRKLAEATGLDKGYVSKMLNRKKAVSEKARNAFLTVLSQKPDNLIHLESRR